MSADTATCAGSRPEPSDVGALRLEPCARARYARALKVLSLTDTELVAEQGPVLIRIVDGGITNHHTMDRVIAYYDEMLTRYPAIGFVVVFEHGTSPPDSASLRYIRQRSDAYGDRLVVAIVAAGLGFWASALVRLAAAFARASRHTLLVATNLEQAIEQLSMELVGIDAAEIVEQCERLRKQLQDRRRVTS